MYENHVKSFNQALTIFEDPFLKDLPVGSVETLKAIHRHIFQDVFDFAGQYRTVNISKGNFRFCIVDYLEKEMLKVEQLPQDTFAQIIHKYCEYNVVHPFREGNGRTGRIWLDMMLIAELGKCIDWDKVDKYSYLSAMERSVVNTLEIRVLLENALTSDISNRKVFMKGLIASYKYEDLDVEYL